VVMVNVRMMMLKTLTKTKLASREPFGGGECTNDDAKCKDVGGGQIMVLIARWCVVMLVLKKERGMGSYRV